MAATYEIKQSDVGITGDKVILKREMVTRENIQELTLNDLEEQLSSANRQLLDAQERVQRISAEIAEVKRVLKIK